MARVLNNKDAEVQAAKLGITAQQLGQLVYPLWILLYKHKRTSITLTRDGMLGIVAIE